MQIINSISELKLGDIVKITNKWDLTTWWIFEIYDLTAQGTCQLLDGNCSKQYLVDSQSRSWSVSKYWFDAYNVIALNR